MNKRKDALEALLAPAKVAQSSAVTLERKSAATPGALKVMGIALRSLNRTPKRPRRYARSSQREIG